MTTTETHTPQDQVKPEYVKRAIGLTLQYGKPEPDLIDSIYSELFDPDSFDIDEVDLRIMEQVAGALQADAEAHALALQRERAEAIKECAKVCWDAQDEFIGSHRSVCRTLSNRLTTLSINNQEQTP
jgi:hypothetical protein